MRQFWDHEECLQNCKGTATTDSNLNGTNNEERNQDGRKHSSPAANSGGSSSSLR